MLFLLNGRSRLIKAYSSLGRKIKVKRVILILCYMFLLIGLLGCQQNSENNNPKKPYDSEEAIENGDVVNLHGEISNLDKLKNFVKNVESGVKDEIRITMYTHEGDPIFDKLDHDGNKIQYTHDDTQDGYAGSGKGIKSTSCSNIESRNTEDGVEYYLSECSSEVGNTFNFLIPN